MPAAAPDAALVASLHKVVQANIHNIFGPSGDGLQLVELSMSGVLHRRSDRYHRALMLRYASDGEVGEKRIWLKFLTHARARYDIYVAIWEQTRDVCGLFPQPYFCAEWGEHGVIGMELVEGASLRNLFLRQAFLRRGVALNRIFEDFGAALRAFHDSSHPSGFRTLRDLEDSARRLVAGTEHLTSDERVRALDRIADAAERAGSSELILPLIPVHHDCSLRNVVVRHDGSPCLIDLDALRAPWRSRWYDVAAFLVNLESQIKYAPLGDPESIASAWLSFWRGYAGAELPDGLSLEQFHAVLLLIKFEYLFGGVWRPLFDVYTGVLASRYVRRLKDSVLRSEEVMFAPRPEVPV